MKVLSQDEENIMRITTSAAFERAADIIDKITAGDVLDMQARGLAEGMTLDQVARIDRAMLAASHLRACARGEFRTKE